MSILFENMVRGLKDEDFNIVLSTIVREALRRNFGDQTRLMTLISNGGAPPAEWFEPSDAERKLFRTNPISAIKDLRNRTGCALKDAKDKLEATCPTRRRA